jgi:hypothetical protein
MEFGPIEMGQTTMKLLGLAEKQITVLPKRRLQ